MAAGVGSARLLRVFDDYEALLGRYPYGRPAASVDVDWGAAAYGGIQHHPYWLVHTTPLADPVVHAPRAAHGWFGDAHA